MWRRVCLAPCALLLAVASAGAGAQRIVVPLDLGWRVAPAPFPSTCPAYNIRLQGYLGNSGWVVEGGAASGTAACQAAACAHNAQAWSYCEQGRCGTSPPDVHHTGPGPWCIIGAAGRISPVGMWPCTGNCSWTTRARDTSMGPNTATTPQAQRGFNDGTWRVVDLPHDASIELPYVADSDGPEGFHPSVQTFYRKRFRMPASWGDGGHAITLVIDGALVSSSWWINGVQTINMKTDGYLPTTLRLDNIPTLNLTFGEGGSANVITVWTDNSATTGWWYEGSGLVRHARLVVTPIAARLQPAFAVAAPATVIGTITMRHTPADGLSANASVSPSADVCVAASATNVTVTFELFAIGGTIALGRSMASRVITGDATIAGPPIVIADAELWSVARPHLYTLVTTLTSGDATRASQDSVNSTIGIRQLVWDPTDGLHVNTQAVKMRGFCNHESFSGVGAAIPLRVDLFRVQQMRGVGGNAWRTVRTAPYPLPMNPPVEASNRWPDYCSLRALKSHLLHVICIHLSQSLPVSTPFCLGQSHVSHLRSFPNSILCYRHMPLLHSSTPFGFNRLLVS